MNQAPIMPFFTDAYLADCHHLSTEAHGTLLLILLHMWRRGGKALPNNNKAMMHIVKAGSLRKWHLLKTELEALFDLSDRNWRQKKLERTWTDVMSKVEANRTNGKRGRAVQMLEEKSLKTQTKRLRRTPAFRPGQL